MQEKQRVRIISRQGHSNSFRQFTKFQTSYSKCAQESSARSSTPPEHEIYLQPSPKPVLKHKVRFLRPMHSIHDEVQLKKGKRSPKNFGKTCCKWSVPTCTMRKYAVTKLTLIVRAFAALDTLLVRRFTCQSRRARTFALHLRQTLIYHRTAISQ